MKKGYIVAIALLFFLVVGRSEAENFSDETTLAITNNFQNNQISGDVGEKNDAKNIAPKIDLKAVILDPDAKFDGDSKLQNREMTDIEKWEYQVHDALHCQVCKLDSTPLLHKYLSHDFERGPLTSISAATYFRGSLQNIWNQDEYKNTLYSDNFLYTIFEGKF